MPIRIPDSLPARAVLESENIFVMTEFRAMHQDIRPLNVLILNLMLPYQDGLSVLQKTPFQPPIVLATTTYVNPYILHRVTELGVDYTMISPSVEALCLRLRDLLGSACNLPPLDDPHATVCYHLRMLGIPAHLDGYRQLCAAIPCFAENPGQLLTKELYPAVAELCGSTDSRTVEHSIRKAIENAWRCRDNAVWRKYFPPNNQGQIPCPTNKAFLCRLAELLEQQTGAV